MLILTPEEINATIDRVLPQLPAGHTGALITDVDSSGITFGAELQKSGDAWTLDAKAAFKFDWVHNTESAGANIVWSWK